MSSVEYLVARCHGLRTRLIPHSTLTSLIKVENVETFAEALLKTDYGNSVRAIPWNEINGFILERVFAKKMVERCYFLLKIASSSVAQFLCAYYRRFEVQNICHVLRGKAGNLPKDSIEKGLMPINEYSSINFEALILSKDAVDAVRMLAETIYYPPEIVFQSYVDSDSLLPFEGYFKRVYARELVKDVEGLPEDVDCVNRLLRIEFDVENCISAVGGIFHSLDSSLIESFIIPYSYKVSTGDILRVICGDQSNSMITSVFSPYGRIVDLLLAGREADASIEGFRYLYEESEKHRLSRAYSFAFILTYLISCEVERRNLTTIALGKEYEIDWKEITTHIIL